VIEVRNQANGKRVYPRERSSQDRATFHGEIEISDAAPREEVEIDVAEEGV
jgi:hypothetical protein